MSSVTSNQRNALSLSAQVSLLANQAQNYKLAADSAKRRMKEVAEVIREVEATLPTADAPLQERLEAKGARKLAAKIRKRLGKWGYV